VIKKRVKNLLSKTSPSSRTEVLESLKGLAATSSTVIHPSRQVGKSFLKQQLARTPEVSILDSVLANSADLLSDLETLERDISAIYSLADELDAALLSARLSSKAMLADRSRLLENQRKAKDQAEVLESFNVLFNVSEEHLAALDRASSSPLQDVKSPLITVSFFEALERVQAVHANCRLLLRGNHRRAGLALMDRMSGLQEKAYESLCRWVQTGMSLNDGGEGEDSLLHRAIAALRTRPVLLKYCAEEVASARHNSFFRKFLDALTAPAMERERISRPSSYVSKVFDWISGNMDKERRLFHRLFSESGSSGNIASLLDRVFEGVCRPLSTRIEQVLQVNNATRQLDLFQICLTLSTYSGQLREALGEESALAKTTREYYGKAVEAFEVEMTQRQSKKLLASSEASFEQELKVLADLGSLSSKSLDSGKEGGDIGVLEAALSRCVGRLCDFCESMADHQARNQSKGEKGFSLGKISSSGGGAGSDSTILLINALFRVLGTLEKEEGGLLGGTGVRERVSGLLEGLVSSFQPTGLRERLERIGMYQGENGQFSAEISRDPDLSLDILRTQLDDIHNYLLELLRGEKDDKLKQLDLLAAPEARSMAQNKVLVSFSDAYACIYSSIAAQGKAGHIQHSPDYIKDLVKTLC